MANSRYDNIRYYDGSFKIPTQIKVYNGSSWVDLGTKTSTSKKKLNVYDGSRFICATYEREDVNIPKTVELGAGKYAWIHKSNGKNARVDTWLNGYVWEMWVEVYSSTTLYTAYAKNQGDITNQAYINFYADVNGSGKVRFRVVTRFHGNQVGTGKFLNSGPYTGSTGYLWNKGDKVHIKVVNKAKNGAFYVTVENSSGSKIIDDVKLGTGWCTLQVETPDKHHLGECTIKDNGTTEKKGKALVHRFRFKPDRSGDYFDVNFNNAGNNATTVVSTGAYKGEVVLKGTKVYGKSYTRYNRQSI